MASAVAAFVSSAFIARFSSAVISGIATPVLGIFCVSLFVGGGGNGAGPPFFPTQSWIESHGISSLLRWFGRITSPPFL